MEILTLGLFCAGLILCIILKFSILYALGAGLVLFWLYGRRKGFSWKRLFVISLEGVMTARNILLTFLLIGVMTALWRAAGTIPVIVSFASTLIRPSILVLMTFLLALFLAFAKRKDDYRIFEQTGIMPRKSIVGYNAQFIDLSVTIVATITIVCYIMYTMSDSVIERMGSSYLYLTSIWVIAGLLRHLQNMLVYQRSGSPTKALVKDHFIQLCIAGWIASFVAIIYW